MRQSESFHRAEQQDLIEKALEKAEGVLARDEIDIASFVDLYGQANISHDQKYVSQREAEFEKNMSDAEREHIKLAKVFEAILHEHGEQSNWFGDTAITVKTSRFDDIANGVDEIVEFEEPTTTSYLALAIDATYSTFTDKKLERIRDEIDKGVLSMVKYGAFESNGFRGEVKKVPRVVVGVSAKTILELAELWLSGRNQELANHPVQFQILETILLQCEAFQTYAKKMRQPEVARKYEQTLNIIRRVIEEKKKTLKDSGARDDVFVSLDLGLNQFRA